MSQNSGLFNELNEEQQRAINSDGVSLVFAGAGSGKTRTLIYKLARVLLSGFEPSKIVALTFTNKAAQEMKERVAKLVHKQLQTKHGLMRTFVGTFHSWGAKFLRQEGFNPLTIYDDEDSLKLIKEIITGADFDLEPKFVQETISYAKNRLIDPISFSESGISNIERNISEIWQIYEKKLKERKAFDFDDLLLSPLRMLSENTHLREKYQYQYVLVDEFQDTNLPQYLLVKTLIEKNKNLFVVGDDYQCLTPETLVATSKNTKKAEELQVGDNVMTASGNNGSCVSEITKVYKSNYCGQILKITTNNNQELKITPNHIVFLKFPPTHFYSKFHYVYLMYRKDKGYRIGIAKGVRNLKKSKTEFGLRVRYTQERADKMWILKICKNREDAWYWESYLSLKYGVPTIVFDVSGRNMKTRQSTINKIFNDLDTHSNTKKLLEEFNLSQDYPHLLAQATIRFSRHSLRIRISMFSDKRKSLVSPWGLSRLSINTSDKAIISKLEKLGFKTRKGKKTDRRLEIARLNYSEIEKIANEIKEKIPEFEIIKYACLTKNKSFLLQPASNLIPGMVIAILKNGKITETTIKKIEQENYSGMVFDFDIKNTHNYIANNIVVHNSIYGFRGSNYRNILELERDFPGLNTFVLGRNYRSTKKIVESATQLILNNKLQKHKNLWTNNKEGDNLNIFEAYNEDEEAEIVSSIIYELLESQPPSDIAVLYRVNFLSRALEEKLLLKKIPYRIFGGVHFYQRKEIKDIIAYLRILNNPRDLISLRRIINTPTRGIGAKAQENFFKLGDNAIERLLINGESAREVQNFLKIYFNLKQLMTETLPFSEFLKNLLDITKYLEYIKEDYDRIYNVSELISVASKFDNMELSEAFQEFLNLASLWQQHDEIDQDNKIKLMTIHLAKGLEFKNIFIVGMEEGIFPHYKSINNDLFSDNSNLEEERRLAYVAITRAKEKVFLTYTKRRRQWGKFTDTIPSRFISELPVEYTNLHNLGM